MSQRVVEARAATVATERRVKLGARRKITVVLGGVVFGGVVAFALETAGLPAQLASTVGGALTALCAAAEELRELRAEPRSTRVERLVRGDVYRHPLLMAFYTALALFLAVNLGLLPFVFGMGGFLFLTGLEQDYPLEVWEPYIYSSMYIPMIALLPFLVIPIAKSIAHRVRTRPMLWIGGAITVSWVVGGAIRELSDLPRAEDGGFSSTWAWGLDIFGWVLAIGAAAVGCIWARRTQSTFVMRKLYRQLSTTDKHEIVELIKTLPMARSDIRSTS